ncbi:MAG: 50S ribosomal protein L35ae [Candidatus Woesearchaeota archaeon]|nr:MAG: 50S ribosomal protein L35ae [Candidatus Woesearchaeota archaeon]
MEGQIVHFRQGRHHTYPNQMIATLKDVSSREKAASLVGKNVQYNTGKNIIAGTIQSAHGNKGAVRILFEKGMPGQAIGGKITLA